MKRMGIRELKSQMSEVLRQVQEGEMVELTKHGEVIALLMPARRRVNEEQVRVALARLDTLAAEIGKHVTESTNVAEMISEMRR